MNCELCGQKPAVYDSEIEGTTMKVCVDCSRFGSRKHKSSVRVVIKDKRPETKEPLYVFIQGYGAIVKNARERLGLKQEEMAKRLNEKESLLHQIESEHLKPSVDLARKIERELRIKIMEEIQDSTENTLNKSNLSNDYFSSKHSASKNLGLTLGDFINNKKK